MRACVLAVCGCNGGIVWYRGHGCFFLFSQVCLICLFVCFHLLFVLISYGLLIFVVTVCYFYLCRGDRYDALRLCVGEDTVQRLARLKLFMVKKGGMVLGKGLKRVNRESGCMPGMYI